MTDAAATMPEVLAASVTVEGMRFPKEFETNRPMAEQIQCIRQLEMREDDVLLCAYPKAGTHWMWEVASMLVAGSAEYEKRNKAFTMMEASEIEKIQALPSPRVLNTHVRVDMLPAQVTQKKVKVIHVYRNIKDLVVSLYFHLKQAPHLRHMTLDFAVQNVTGPMRYVYYLQTMDKFIKDNPDLPVFNLSYEEAKEDPEGVVKRMGEFLGVPPSPQLCSDIVRATSFSRMKAHDVHKDHPQHLSHLQLFRKGVVGDWKNHLTVAQSERLDAAVLPLQSCNYRFRYTL